VVLHTVRFNGGFFSVTGGASGGGRLSYTHSLPQVVLTAAASTQTSDVLSLVKSKKETVHGRSERQGTRKKEAGRF
jgi:hypothetical protein